MPAYLGTPGALFPIECETFTVESEDGYQFDTTLEGRRKAQARRLRPRMWKVEMGLSSSDETANVRALDAGEYGPGPFVWLTEEAQAVNALAPEVSACGPDAINQQFNAANASVGGPLTLDGGGLAGRSLQSSDLSKSLIFGDKLPVVPGATVTGSAWALGAGAYVRLYWYDGAGALAGSTLGAASTGTSAARQFVTGTAPAGATQFLLAAMNCPQAARPAVTYGPALAAWAPGAGCPKAVLSKLENAPALLGDKQSHGRVAFTISEVG